MSHCDRKWKNSEESVAACAHKQRRQKTNKDDRNITGYEQVAMCDCASSLSCCSAWPWPKLMYKQKGVSSKSNSNLYCKAEGCRVMNGGCRIKSEEWRV